MESLFSILDSQFKGQENQDILLLSVQVLEEKIALNLECQIMHSADIGSMKKFGVQFKNKNTSESLEIFYDKVYYPFYIRYLESLRG